MVNSLTIAIGKRCRMARELSHKTQAEAAEALGITRPSVTQKENGQFDFTASEICILADLYEVSVARLLGREAEDKNSLPIDDSLLFQLGRLSRRGQRAVVSLLEELRGNE